MIRSAILVAAALSASAVSSIATPAFAADLPRAEIRYADLNLKTADGAQALRARVERAADRVCGTHGVVDLRTRMEARQCAETALAKAMPQVELALANAQKVQVAENRPVSVLAH